MAVEQSLILREKYKVIRLTNEVSAKRRGSKRASFSEEFIYYVTRHFLMCWKISILKETSCGKAANRETEKEIGDHRETHW
jgi:hypothetical protein